MTQRMSRALFSRLLQPSSEPVDPAVCVRDRKSNLHGFVDNTTQHNTTELELKLSNVIILYFFVVSRRRREEKKVRYVHMSAGDTRQLFNFSQIVKQPSEHQIFTVIARRH